MSGDRSGERNVSGHDTVWIFHGSGAPFASGVFHGEQEALAWIDRHRLTGNLTEYVVGEGCYDLAVTLGDFRPSRPHHGSPDHVARFSPTSNRHIHVRDGRPDPPQESQPAAMPAEREGGPLWLIKIAVLATHNEVDRLTEDLVTTICPSPDHDGDCTIPWTLTTVTGSSLPRRQQADIRESIRMTNPEPRDVE